MKTKYDIGDTVLVEYTIRRIYADDTGIVYKLCPKEQRDSRTEIHDTYIEESDIYGSLPQNGQKPDYEQAESFNT